MKRKSIRKTTRGSAAAATAEPTTSAQSHPAVRAPRRSRLSAVPLAADEPKPRIAAKPRSRRAPSRSRGRAVAPRPLGPISRALISVYDKDGVVELARELSGMGIEILSTGGTARLLLDNGIEVDRIASYTGFPEMLDGRVKTLHPKIHAGIMAVRNNDKHMKDIRRAGFEPIDLVVCNLYPFEKTAAMPGIGLDEVVEMIDVGGPTMVRAAAKNFRHVGIVVDPLDYRRTVAQILERGDLPLPYRFDLARKAFQHVAAYDTAIFSYLSRLQPDGTLPPDRRSPFPDRLALDFVKVQDLRYGENPHQTAGFYREISSAGPSIASALKLQGKDLSFNNIVDLDSALALLSEFDRPASVIIKHSNPCGAAVGDTALEAYTRAFETDPMSAFGGVIGLNVPLDRETAEAVSRQFVEVVVAPSIAPEAIEVLASKKQLRLLEVGNLREYHFGGFDLKRVNAGLLVQEWDVCDAREDDLRVVTRRAPTAEEMQALLFAWKVVKHVRSNAIVYAAKDRTLGIGAGQMSRVDSARIGAEKANRPLAGSVLASDAFFPFRDGLDEAAARGVTAVIQPGGSVRDQERIAAADEHGIAMVFTGYRHFRH